MSNKERQLSRRSFLKNVGKAGIVAAVGAAGIGSPAERQEQRVSSPEAGSSSKNEISKKEIMTAYLSENSLAARLLELDENDFTNSEQPSQKDSYLVWRLPLDSVEGCEEVRKFRTYKVFSEDKLGPSSCKTRAEVFYADWAKEGEGAWRVFVTGGNPSPGEYCSVLIADCDTPDSADAVKDKLTKGGCSEEAWCTNIQDCVESGGKINISSIQACKEIEDICCE